MSFTTEELESRTSAASVDIDAERISRSIRIVRDSGMTLVNSSGISASNTGLPALKAAGVFSGERNMRAAAPVKYAVPEMMTEKTVEAIMPMRIARLSFIA